MNIIEIIDKKRQNIVLSKAEIEFAVNGFTRGEIKNEQMSALLMAICINGLSEQEIFDLCEVMTKSGKPRQKHNIDYVLCDKHSTGGVSDTTTLIILPILASLKAKMLKSSGRALGFTGGTADKIECFENIDINLSLNSALKQVEKIGGCLITQSEDLCPADKKIYALRDVTGTTQSLPLIATSIMSKKLAGSCDVLVLDVKYGKGALLSEFKEAKCLAEIMVKIAKRAGKKVLAVLSDMSQPLGFNIGDKLEVMEAIEALEGKNSRLLDLAKFLAVKIYSLATGEDEKVAKERVEDAVYSKKALNKLEEIVKTQKGVFEKPELKGVKKYEILSSESGYILEIDPVKLANIVRFNGGGRLFAGDEINHNIGIKTFVKVGDFVKAKSKLCEVYVCEKFDKSEALGAFKITAKKVKPPKLVGGIVK